MLIKFLWPFFLQVSPRNSADSDPALEEDAQSSRHPNGQGYGLFYHIELDLKPFSNIVICF